MNINQKIWTGFGSVLALVAVGSTLTYFKSREAEQASIRLVAVNVAEFRAAKFADDGVSQARIYEQKFTNTRGEAWIAQLKLRTEAVKADMKTVQAATATAAHAAAAAAIITAVDGYVETFDRYHQLMVRRGLTPESGLEGQLRAAVHAVEAKVKDQGHADLTVLLLMVRRHEKDYLLRGDPKYLAEIVTRIREFDEQMLRLSLPADLQKDLAAKWAGYGAAMKALEDTDQAARRTSDEMAESGDAMELQVGALAESCSKQIDVTQVLTLRTLSDGRRTSASPPARSARSWPSGLRLASARSTARSAAPAKRSAAAPARSSVLPRS